MKASGCIFRVQYSKRVGKNPAEAAEKMRSEPFRFSKGRDMHNHAFSDPSTIMDTNQAIISQTSYEDPKKAKR